MSDHLIPRVQPYHESGSAPLSAFVRDFASALGTPNVVLTGLHREAGSTVVRLVGQLSSPVFNATERTLTFSATRVGEFRFQVSGFNNHSSFDKQACPIQVLLSLESSSLALRATSPSAQSRSLLTVFSWIFCLVLSTLVAKW